MSFSIGAAAKPPPVTNATPAIELKKNVLIWGLSLG
jgi:hypothetical protein